MTLRRIATSGLVLAILALVLGAPEPAVSEDGAAASPTAVIPTTSPLAKIKEGMDSNEVTKILGEPTSTGRHVTGKAFIPFYFGTDAVKTEWRYKNLGRVIFSKGSFSCPRWNTIPTRPARIAELGGTTLDFHRWFCSRIQTAGRVFRNQGDARDGRSHS